MILGFLHQLCKMSLILLCHNGSLYMMHIWNSAAYNEAKMLSDHIYVMGTQATSIAILLSEF